MKGALVFVIFALAVLPYSTGLVQYLLRRMAADDQEYMISRCLESVTRFYRSRYRQMIIILDDSEIGYLRLARATTARFIRYRIADVRYQKLIGVTVLPNKKRIKRLLRWTRWSPATRFVVVLPRMNQTDGLYVEDFELQDAGLHYRNTVKSPVIRRYFSNDLLPRNETLWSSIRNMTSNLFGEFWDSRVLNVVAAVPQKTRIYFYTYFPYTSKNCAEDFRPVLINVWFSGNRTFLRTLDFYPGKERNLYGCRLNVSLVVSPPALYFSPASGRLEGLEGELMRMTFERLNATPHYHRFGVEEWFGNRSTVVMSKILKDVAEGDYDFGAGLLIPTIAHANQTDYINFGLTVCLTWAVPSNAMDPIVATPLWDAYSSDVWILIQCTALFVMATYMGSIYANHRRIRFAEPAFEVLAMLLGKGAKLPKENFLRVLLLGFILFAGFLNTLFQARFGSSNIVVDPPKQLETTDDVVNSGLEITGDDATVIVFNRYLKLARDSGEVIRVVPLDIKTALLKVAFGRGTAYAGLRLAIRYQVYVDQPELAGRIHIQQRCLAHYHSFLALKRNSPFTSRVYDLMFSLVESGFSERLHKQNMRRVEKRRREILDGALRIDINMGALQVWAGGLFWSFMAFLCEIIFHRIEVCVKQSNLMK